jgi:hypothetical protein
MAVALVAMATAQLVMGLALLKASRRVTEATDSLRRDVAPLIANATRMTEDAAKVAALAAIQAKRVDELIASISTQVNETMAVVRDVVEGPARQGAAVVAGFKAIMSAIREWQSQTQQPRNPEDEDPLFVG